MTAETPTPRTDAAAFYGTYVRKGEAAVDVEFARKRRCTELLAKLREAAGVILWLRNHYDVGHFVVKKEVLAETDRVLNLLPRMSNITPPFFNATLASAPSAKEGQPGEQSGEGK